jgi:hypothetical protein
MTALRDTWSAKCKVKVIKSWQTSSLGLYIVNWLEGSSHGLKHSKNKTIRSVS